MNDSSLPPFHPEPPSPTSLCPVCGNADWRDRLYFRAGANEAIYSCDRGHNWLVRWLPAGVA